MIFGTILKKENGRTQKKGPENKKIDDNVQGIQEISDYICKEK